MVLVGALGGACAQGPEPTPPEVYSEPELKYRLLSSFDDVFYVDPDYYPVAREGREEKNALEQFPVTRAHTAEFSAILAHLGLDTKAEYTAEEELLVYREHKKLTHAVQLADSGGVYSFSLRVGEGQGELIEGTITLSGTIRVLKREPSFNTYPICLAEGTLIAAPAGPIPVERLHEGAVVWTADDSGRRTAAAVVKIVMTAVPASFEVLEVRLDDGRIIIASPGHPTAERRALSEYQAGDTLDGALVVAVDCVSYHGSATYDLLPASPTGLYWANGILLMSTLSAE
jgi:hypothetical protein